MDARALDLTAGTTGDHLAEALGDLMLLAADPRRNADTAAALAWENEWGAARIKLARLIDSALQRPPRARRRKPARG